MIKGQLQYLCVLSHLTHSSCLRDSRVKFVFLMQAYHYYPEYILW